LVQDVIISFVCCSANDQFVDIFMKPLTKANFVKFWAMIGLKEATIMGGCTKKLISPPESPKNCVGRGGVGIESSSHLWIFWRQPDDS
jgi:hypothetical protein